MVASVPVCRCPSAATSASVQALLASRYLGAYWTCSLKHLDRSRDAPLFTFSRNSPFSPGQQPTKPTKEGTDQRQARFTPFRSSRFHQSTFLRAPPSLEHFTWCPDRAGVLISFPTGSRRYFLVVLLSVSRKAKRVFLFLSLLGIDVSSSPYIFYRISPPTAFSLIFYPSPSRIARSFYFPSSSPLHHHPNTSHRHTSIS